MVRSTNGSGRQCNLLFLVMLLSIVYQPWSSPSSLSTTKSSCATTTSSSSSSWMAHAFVLQNNNGHGRYPSLSISSRLAVETHQPTSGSIDNNDDNDDPEEVIARRIIVKGDVQGGYYRSCVLNEVSNEPFVSFLFKEDTDDINNDDDDDDDDDLVLPVMVAEYTMISAPPNPPSSLLFSPSSQFLFCFSLSLCLVSFPFRCIRYNIIHSTRLDDFDD
jgi:hypothetical protein